MEKVNKQYQAIKRSCVDAFSKDMLQEMDAIYRPNNRIKDTGI